MAILAETAKNFMEAKITAYRERHGSGRPKAPPA